MASGSEKYKIVNMMKTKSELRGKDLKNYYKSDAYKSYAKKVSQNKSSNDYPF